METANPYAVLGLGFGASRDDAEAAYHRLLFQWHPDRHAAEGPEAVARAEAETRRLNDAIDQIRRGAVRPTGVRSRPPPHPGDGAWPDAGDEVRVHGPVPCPFCGEPMTSLAAFDAHLRERHPRMAVPRHRKARSGRRWWPVSTAAFFLANLIVVLVVMFAVLVMGGHDATMDRLEGISPAERSAMAASDPARCPDGRYPATRGPDIGGPCSDHDWPLGYLTVGLFPSVLYFTYRRTTR